MLRALLHAWRTGHRIWHDTMHWPGQHATVYFCTCGEQFWPLTKEGPYPDWRDNPVRRNPPEENQQ